MNVTFDTERSITISHLVKAPLDLVWRACTDPEQIDRWWGPNGFMNKTIAHELRVGGEWKYTMTGPDGKVWQNLITYTEVTPMARLAYHHGDWENPRMFEGSLTFSSVEGGTMVVLRNVFPTTEARDFVVEHHGAIQGGQQTLTRLADHVQPN
jgi:uncharacterized protein YndB with AHSA1/START domain